MARYKDAIGAVKAQFKSDLAELGRVQDEQAKLRPSYTRFLDLEKQKASLMERTETAAGLLAVTLLDDCFPDELSDALEDVGIPSRENLREKIPLWRFIAEIVRQFPKIRIVELMRILGVSFEIDVSRQAVESALRTHGARFRITTKGREKFVSLK